MTTPTGRSRTPPEAPLGRPGKGIRLLRRLPWIILAVVLIVYGGWLLVIYVAQERFIFPRAFEVHTDNDAIAAGATRIWRESPDGVRLEAWYQAAPAASADHPRPAAIFFHGNGDVVDERWYVAGPYLEHGVSFLIWEYRGYGRVAGTPSEPTLIADGIDWVDWLASRPEVDPQRVILHGISLGGGIALGVAERRTPAAIILESTFSSITRLGMRLGIPPGMARHPLRSDQRIARLDVPILLVHGRNDWTIPVDHSRRLAAAARRARLVETDAGHHNYRTDWDAITEFLGELDLIRKP